jgi:hypothetical protein
VLSAEHDEAMPGSALRGRRWLLIELAQPWAKNPSDTPPLAGDLGVRLAAAAAARDAQVVLIRRPTRGRTDGSQAWFVVDHGSRAVTEGRWSAATDLLAAEAALLGAGSPEQSGPAVDGQFILVCTHAKRDACCAQWGRPVAGVLAARWPERVWEASHLGGHRFAPTVLVLPEGVHYGRLGRDVAAAVIGRHLAGAVDAAYLRGVTYAEPPEQAAIVEALGRYGPVRADDVDVLESGALGDDRWRVVIRGRGPLPTGLVATVTRRWGVPAVQSCGGAELVAPAQYDVTLSVREPS